MTTEATVEIQREAEAVNAAEEEAKRLAKTPEVEETPEDEILDLATIAPNRQKVRLPTKQHPDGELFDIRLLDDFGIIEQQQLLNWSRKVERLWNSETPLTDSEGLDLKDTLDRLFDRVLDAPKRKKADMNDGQRFRVVTAFSLAPLLVRQRLAAQAEAKAADLQTTET